MSVYISAEGCAKNNLTLSEAFILLAYHTKADFEKCKESLFNKGLISTEYDSLFQPSGIWVTRAGKELIDSLILDSDNRNPDEKYLSLASELKGIFPSGKKSGTNYYWSDGKALIARRLKMFFKKYGDSYTHEQIIDAAKRYVDSFNGNYQYMKLLKYFILKEKVGASGEVEGESELISYIENAGQEDSLRDWTTELK